MASRYIRVSMLRCQKGSGETNLSLSGRDRPSPDDTAGTEPGGFVRLWLGMLVDPYDNERGISGFWRLPLRHSSEPSTATGKGTVDARQKAMGCAEKTQC